MQVLIVLVCCLSGLARASLEPAGYRPPGSHPESSYLPPASSHSAPDNRYIPSSVGRSGHPATFNSQVSSSRGFSLPSKNTPAPFAQYLPANRQPSHPGVAATRNFAQNSSPARQYIPASVEQRSYTPSLPVNDYLPARQSQSVVSAPSNSYLAPSAHSAPSNAYLAPNSAPSGPSNAYLAPNVQSAGFSGQSDFASAGHHSGSLSVNRQSKFQQGNGGRYSSAQTQQSGSAGYRYNAPENQIPAKYDFEYDVKDNYGNDYGHRESRSGENTQGVYTVVLPDGRRQTVHYEADSHGYRPTITYEQTGSQTAYNNNNNNNDQGYHY